MEGMEVIFQPQRRNCQNKIRIRENDISYRALEKCPLSPPSPLGCHLGSSPLFGPSRYAVNIAPTSEASGKSRLLSSWIGWSAAMLDLRPRIFRRLQQLYYSLILKSPIAGQVAPCPGLCAARCECFPARSNPGPLRSPSAEGQGDHFTEQQITRQRSDSGLSAHHRRPVQLH